MSEANKSELGAVAVDNMLSENTSLVDPVDFLLGPTKQMSACLEHNNEVLDLTTVSVLHFFSVISFFRSISG